MAAGLGFKTFTTGEVLTASDVNGYLMQGVLVFASAAARNAAITSPQEGQFAFTKDTNGLWYYDGAAWVASGATGDIEGVTAGTGLTGGGTSGTVTVSLDTTSAYVVPSQTGNSGKYLTTNGTASSWATASSGGMTLIATGTGTGSSATITFSSIPSTYKHLMLVFEEVRTSSGGASVNLKFNSSSANYDYRFSGTDTTNDWNATVMYTFYTVADADVAGAYSNGVMWMFDYAGAHTNKTGTGLWSYGVSGGGSNGYRTGTFRWRNTSAINSIAISNGGPTNFGTATVIKLYGVS